MNPASFTFGLVLLAGFSATLLIATTFITLSPSNHEHQAKHVAVSLSTPTSTIRTQAIRHTSAPRSVPPVVPTRLRHNVPQAVRGDRYSGEGPLPWQRIHSAIQPTRQRGQFARLQGFEVGHATSEVMAIRNRWEDEYEVPVAFECDGLSFALVSPLPNQGQDSVTALVVEANSDVPYVAKFALEHGLDARPGQSVHRLQNEARILRELAQGGVDHVVRLVASCVLDDDTVVMVMEKVDGEPSPDPEMIAHTDPDTLKERLRQVVRTAVKIVNQGVVNLDQMHNIMCDGSECVLIDFGNAQHINDKGDRYRATLIARHLEQYFRIVPKDQYEWFASALKNEILSDVNLSWDIASREAIVSMWNLFASGSGAGPMSDVLVRHYEWTRQ